ncbi:hypothetical protein [Sphingomonas panacis]|uniref:hypothetical protein n=1 Tax=Sphingomonas panacis TaxID=1560345 RepID=UPI0012371862|nr:hypothetical protein [Sphingomonas panacis]
MRFRFGRISEAEDGRRIEAGLLQQVPLDLPERQFGMIRRPERNLSPTETTFGSMLRSAGKR